MYIEFQLGSIAVLQRMTRQVEGAHPDLYIFIFDKIMMYYAK